MRANILQNEKGDYNLAVLNCTSNIVDGELVCEDVTMTSNTFNYLIHAILSERNKILSKFVSKINGDKDIEQSEDNDIQIERDRIIPEMFKNPENEISINQ